MRKNDLDNRMHFFFEKMEWGVKDFLAMIVIYNQYLCKYKWLILRKSGRGKENIRLDISKYLAILFGYLRI